MPFDYLRPSQLGAPGSMNVHTLNGRMSPAFDVNYLSTTDRQHYYIGALETKAPLGSTSGGHPRQYSAVGRSVFRLDSGTITDDLTNFQSTNDAFNDIVQGMVIYDIPSITDVTSFTAGSPGLIISFGNGNPDPGAGRSAMEGVYYRSLSTDTTPWAVNGDASRSTEATQGTTYLTCWQMAKAGPDLYAVCDAGTSTTIGDYRVSKCPQGNNPILITSWGNGIEVGTADWIINGLAAIGDAPVAGKPDGLWYYDLQKRRFENVLRHFEILPHPLNGKVTQSVTGGVVYTTYDGGAFFFDGVAVQEISPKKLWEFVGKDIGNSRITAVADRGDVITLITDAGDRTTQMPNLVVNRVTAAGAATALTTNVVDGNLTTGSSVDAMVAGDFIDVWADVPFEAVRFIVTRLPNQVVTAKFDQVAYSSATDTFTADPDGFIDGTSLLGNATTATSGGSLSIVAYPPSASAGIVAGKSTEWGKLQTAITFNYSSGTDITTAKYGMRIRLGTADFDAGSADVAIDEVEIVPWRQGMPDGGIFGQATNFTNRDRAGLIPHIYNLKRTNTTGFVAHDSYAVNAYPGVWAMAYHNGRPGVASGQNMLGQMLVGWGRFCTFVIPEGVTRDPARTPYPIVATTSETHPAPLQQIAHEWRGRRVDELTEYKVLKKVKIDTKFLRPKGSLSTADETELFAQFDERDIISLGVAEGGPLEWTVSQAPFRVLNLWIGVQEQFNETDPDCPQFLEPYVIEYDLAEKGYSAMDDSVIIPSTI